MSARVLPEAANGHQDAQSKPTVSLQALAAEQNARPGGQVPRRRAATTLRTQATALLRKNAVQQKRAWVTNSVIIAMVRSVQG